MRFFCFVYGHNICIYENPVKFMIQMLLTWFILVFFLNNLDIFKDAIVYYKFLNVLFFQKLTFLKSI